MTNHLILCLETNNKAKTDTAYVDKTIKYFFKINNNIKISYCYFSGKNNYKNSAILSKINSLQEKTPCDNTTVIYCIDTDNYDSNPSQVALNEEIKTYCNSKGYKLIWFCKDVEEVYWHTQIPDSKKIEAARKFNKHSNLMNATEQSLSSNTYAKKKSNVLKVLDQILVRK